MLREEQGWREVRSAVGGEVIYVTSNAAETPFAPQTMKRKNQHCRDTERSSAACRSSCHDGADSLHRFCHSMRSGVAPCGCTPCTSCG